MKTTKSRKLSKAKIYEAMHSEFYAVFSTIYALAIQQGREEEREACARIVEQNVTECDTCRVKPGSPILCQGCLNNRDSITAAIRARASR